VSVLHRRLAMAAVATAAVIAVPAAALASGSGSPSGKPAPPQAGAAGAVKSEASHADATKSPTRSRLAASAGISTDRLQAGLIAAKRAGGGTAAGIAAFAASAGVSHATAQRMVRAVFGAQSGVSLAGSASVRVLATRLGVSTSAAHHALQRVGALSRSHGVDPSGPAFAAIAHDLGVSPAKLVAALGAVKQSMAGR
jgi:hypothetical protein